MCDIFVVKIAKMQQSFWTSIIIKVIVLQEHLVGKKSSSGRSCTYQMNML